MAAQQGADLAGLLGAHGESASPDAPQALFKTFADALRSAEADVRCGAGYGEHTAERADSRNGYRRHREWDTR